MIQVGEIGIEHTTARPWVPVNTVSSDGDDGPASDPAALCLQDQMTNSAMSRSAVTQESPPPTAPFEAADTTRYEPSDGWREWIPRSAGPLPPGWRRRRGGWHSSPAPCHR